MSSNALLYTIVKKDWINFPGTDMRHCLQDILRKISKISIIRNKQFFI